METPQTLNQRNKMIALVTPTIEEHQHQPQSGQAPGVKVWATVLPGVADRLQVMARQNGLRTTHAVALILSAFAQIPPRRLISTLAALENLRDAPDAQPFRKGPQPPA